MIVCEDKMQIKVFIRPLTELHEGEIQVNEFLKTVSNPSVSISYTPETAKYCACIVYMVSYTEESKNYRDSAGI